MKVVLVAAQASPAGTARAGKVLDLPKEKAEELLAGHYARPFDPEKDAHRSVGLDKPDEPK